MKNYFIRGIITTVAYIIAYLLIDFILGDMHSFWSYAIQTVIFFIVVFVIYYLNGRKKVDKLIPIYMKRLNLLIIGILIFLTSCSRSPERILSQIWGLNVRGLEHHTEFCTDEWCLNGDGLIEIKLSLNPTHK